MTQIKPLSSMITPRFAVVATFFRLPIVKNLDKLDKRYLLVKKGEMNYAKEHEALILNNTEKNIKTSHIVKGISSDGNEYIFDFKLGLVIKSKVGSFLTKGTPFLSKISPLSDWTGTA